MRTGSVLASREVLFKLFAGLQVDTCPFANLPESHKGRWGEGLTAAEVAECRWLKPELVAQIEFVEWTEPEKLSSAPEVGLVGGGTDAVSRAWAKDFLGRR